MSNKPNPILYNIIKLVFTISFVATLGCGYIGYNLSVRNDESCKYWVIASVILLVVSYGLSFYKHDPNDGSDY